MNHLLLYCRPGFEAECAQEIQERLAVVGLYGYPRMSRGAGYVVFICQDADGAWQAMERLRFRSLIFARQWVACLPLLDALDPADRISGVLQAVRPLPEAGELWVETADTTEARELQRFCRKFAAAAAQALRGAGVLSARRNRRQPRLHLFFLDSSQAYAGLSDPSNSAPWEMGVLRLKFPAQAPSRSTLKLDEAWHWFLSPRQRKELLVPGCRATDLGAAPGGWTWQLVNQHMRVVAVDNGPMQPALMDSGLVEHVRGDGFTYVPKKPVEWMVCDIADKPARVCDLVVRWMAQGWCQRTVFNLKLPMKRRYDEVMRCRERIDEALLAEGLACQLDLKHLYHDREEITGYLRAR